MEYKIGRWISPLSNLMSSILVNDNVAVNREVTDKLIVRKDGVQFEGNPQGCSVLEFYVVQDYKNDAKILRNKSEEEDERIDKVITVTTKRR